MADFVPYPRAYGFVQLGPVEGSIQFDPQAYSALSTDTSVVLTVTRTGDLSRAVTAYYQTVNGTATAGDEYTTTAGQLSWASGNDDTLTIMVPLTAGDLYPSEFTVTLLDAVNAEVGANPATVDLTENLVTQLAFHHTGCGTAYDSLNYNWGSQSPSAVLFSEGTVAIQNGEIDINLTGVVPSTSVQLVITMSSGFVDSVPVYVALPQGGYQFLKALIGPSATTTVTLTADSGGNVTGSAT